MIINLNSTDLINNVKNKLFLDDSSPITSDDILKITSLNINRIGYGLKENIFSPEELKYFKNLETCEFSGMIITDEIIQALQTLENLKHLIFDHCTNKADQKLNNKIKKISIIASNYSLIEILKNKIDLDYILFRDIPENVDIEKILDATNLKDIHINDCQIINASNFKSLKYLRSLDLDGSTLDEDSVLESLDINVSNEENFYFRG